MFNNGVQHVHKLLHKLHIEDGSGFRNFIRMVESDLRGFVPENWPQNPKEGTKYCCDCMHPLLD
jgi:hypothetical protein